MEKFAYIFCQRCGKLTSVDSINYAYGRYICKTCNELAVYTVCGSCKLYNKVQQQCVLSKRTVDSLKACCLSETQQKVLMEKFESLRTIKK